MPKMLFESIIEPFSCHQGALRALLEGRMGIKGGEAEKKEDL